MFYLVSVLAVSCIWRGPFVLPCGPVQHSPRTTPSWLGAFQDQISGRTQARLDEVIRQAKKSMNEDKITLVFPSGNPATASDSSAAAPKTVTKRPNMGQTVSFVCETTSENASATLSWTHQGMRVFHNGQLVPGAKHQYKVLLHGQGIILSIINVSFASSGPVTCYERLNTTTRILKRYSLHPNVSRVADVFTVPMPNWSIEAATNKMHKIWCKVHLSLSPKMVAKGEPRDLVIWRHNNKTVVAPRKHPYTLDILGMLITGSFTLSGHDYDSLASTLYFWMMLADVDSTDSGTIECWFRATSDIDEWFIQSARVDVFQPASEAPNEMED